LNISLCNWILDFLTGRPQVVIVGKNSCTIESILTGCVTAWYGNCTTLNQKALQRVVPTAQYITGGRTFTQGGD
jgi:hypothetical protein